VLFDCLLSGKESAADWGLVSGGICGSELSALTGLAHRGNLSTVLPHSIVNWAWSWPEIQSHDQNSIFPTATKSTSEPKAPKAQQRNMTNTTASVAAVDWLVWTVWFPLVKERIFGNQTVPRRPDCLPVGVQAQFKSLSNPGKESGFRLGPTHTSTTGSSVRLRCLRTYPFPSLGNKSAFTQPHCVGGSGLGPQHSADSPAYLLFRTVGRRMCLMTS